MNLQDLKKEIEFKWRKGPAGTQLAYIDARDVMDLLDEVVGAENWQDDYKEIAGNVYAGIGIRCKKIVRTPIDPNNSNPSHNLHKHYEWVWKWDCGAESNIEKEKGQASDAFKRAAVKWGIGRFLYSLDTRGPSTPKNKGQVNKGPQNDNLTDMFDGKLPDEPKRLAGDSQCAGCKSPNVPDNVAEFSQKKYGKVLCFTCQNKIKKKLEIKNG